MKRSDVYQDERYIAMNPFVALQPQDVGETRIVRTWTDTNGFKHEFIIEAPRIAGEYAEQVFIALLYFTYQQRKKGHDLPSCVTVNQSDLFNIMHWPSTGRYSSRLKDSLDYYMSVKITTNTYRQRRELRILSTHVLAGYEIYTQGRRKRVRWEWAPDFLAQIQEGDHLYSNVNDYFSLSTPTSRRCFRLLQALTIPGGKPYVADLKHFAEIRMGMGSTRVFAHVARRLENALEELRAKKLGIGFITENPERIILARYPKDSAETLSIFAELPDRIKNQLPPPRLPGLAGQYEQREQVSRLILEIPVILKDG
ncbi:hypothetical protein Rhom172_2904 (plasmid) [Rhodothermus marinus SG0.5JP17-172]|uniref:replication initiator protein A n=1 Tax=Rhodothermus marinus TaxID=29549 RepID=UPI000223D275|nr:replication initiator protein A [Rhodothermus marinus]AEN74781.1 hypothetical protein Rhom172_2904 [Rhodothermus marinus SG0.5JP17-172]